MAMKGSVKGTVIRKKKFHPRISDLRDRILQYGDVMDDLVEIREEYYNKKNNLPK